MNPRETRGFLNANPGNMDRAPGEPWQGEIRDVNDPRLTEFQRHELTAGRFCVFASAEWGIRALIRNLQAYQRAGDHSVRAMINRWAPPNENNTTGYISRVAAAIGKDADAPVSMTDYATAYAMADAIINVECGGMPYGPDVLEDGLRLAGVVKPVALGTSNTAKGVVLTSTSTLVNASLDPIQQPVQQLADTLEPLAGTSQTIGHIFTVLKVVLTILALVGAGIVIYERVKRERRDVKIDPNPTMVGQ